MRVSLIVYFVNYLQESSHDTELSFNPMETTNTVMLRSYDIKYVSYTVHYFFVITYKKAFKAYWCIGKYNTKQC